MTLLSTKGPQVIFKRVTRHGWGPYPMRVVIVAVIRDGDTNTARVLGVENNRVVEVERAEGVTVEGGKRTRILTADGDVWTVESVGCSCRVPGPLRGVNPLLVP